MGSNCVNDENLCEIRGGNLNFEKCMCNDLKVIFFIKIKFFVNFFQNIKSF